MRALEFYRRKSMRDVRILFNLTAYTVTAYLLEAHLDLYFAGSKTGCTHVCTSLCSSMTPC